MLSTEYHCVFLPCYSTYTTTLGNGKFGAENGCTYAILSVVAQGSAHPSFSLLRVDNQGGRRVSFFMLSDCSRQLQNRKGPSVSRWTDLKSAFLILKEILPPSTVAPVQCTSSKGRQVLCLFSSPDFFLGVSLYRFFSFFYFSVTSVLHCERQIGWYSVEMMRCTDIRCLTSLKIG